MQICKEPSGFFAKSSRAPHGEEEGLMDPISSSTSIYYFTNNFSCGLRQYSPFHMGSVPGLILFWQLPILKATQKNTLQYFHSKSCSGPQCSYVTPSKLGTTCSIKSFFSIKDILEK